MWRTAGYCSLMALWDMSLSFKTYFFYVALPALSPIQNPFPAILVFFLAGFYIPPVCYQSPLLHELQALKARHDGRA